MRIFVSGSLAYDRIMDFPGRFVDHILPEKIHILNVCFMVNGLTERFGGTAGNIAYNLALLGEQPVIVATAGRDFGPYRERLVQLGLPLTGIKEIPEEFTAGAYITTDLADNQITGFNPGAMKYASAYRFDGLDPCGCPGHRGAGESGGHAGLHPVIQGPGRALPVSIRGRASRPGGAPS